MPAPPEFPPDEGQGPISKWEMDRLIRERETLTLEVELTIGGTVEQATHTQIAAEREARIRYIRDRFGKMKGLAKDRFDKER
jgi:hypothetical protein